jgi:hypothetical protein
MFRPDPKPEPRPKKAKQPIRRVSLKRLRDNSTSGRNDPTQGETGELALFDTIWATRPHVSFISDLPISIQPHTPLWYSVFAHVLAKGKYPSFRLLDRNIVLLLPKEHALFDQGTKELRSMYRLSCESYGGGCDWDKLYELREQLKSEYKK